MNRNPYSQNPDELYLHLLNEHDEHIHSGNCIAPVPLFAKYYISVFRELNDKAFGKIDVFNEKHNYKSRKYKI